MTVKQTTDPSLQAGGDPTQGSKRAPTLPCPPTRPRPRGCWRKPARNSPSRATRRRLRLPQARRGSRRTGGRAQRRAAVRGFAGARLTVIASAAKRSSGPAAATHLPRLRRPRISPSPAAFSIGAGSLRFARDDGAGSRPPTAPMAILTTASRVVIPEV